MDKLSFPKPFRQRILGRKMKFFPGALQAEVAVAFRRQVEEDNARVFFHRAKVVINCGVIIFPTGRRNNKLQL